MSTILNMRSLEEDLGSENSKFNLPRHPLDLLDHLLRLAHLPLRARAELLLGVHHVGDIAPHRPLELLQLPGHALHVPLVGEAEQEAGEAGHRPTVGVSLPSRQQQGGIFSLARNCILKHVKR